MVCLKTYNVTLKFTDLDGGAVRMETVVETAVE
jgi:hypothetical protein